MALFQAFSCLSIYLALNIVTSNAQPYTYITNDMVGEVYASVGYKKDAYVQRWLAEGNAIFKALEYLHKKYTQIFEDKSGVELIVASTGGNTCTYIYGEAERITKMDGDAAKPSKIIVVYTLNYVIDLPAAAQEYKDFKEAVDVLATAGATHRPTVDVEVKQFRPVTKDTSELNVNYDYQDFGKTFMGENQVKDQLKRINDLHALVPEEICLSPAEFQALLYDENIKLIVDGIVGSGVKSVNGSNQLLTAIPRAQIRILATTILAFKKNGSPFFVLCNDNPSGMDEYGNWTIDKGFWYPVDIILSCVWHKKLVNSGKVVASRLTTPEALALDIYYESTRLFDKLLPILALLHSTAQDAYKCKLGVIHFSRNPAQDGPMLVDV